MTAARNLIIGLLADVAGHGAPSARHLAGRLVQILNAMDDAEIAKMATAALPNTAEASSK